MHVHTHAVWFGDQDYSYIAMLFLAYGSLYRSKWKLSIGLKDGAKCASSFFLTLVFWDSAFLFRIGEEEDGELGLLLLCPFLGGHKICQLLRRGVTTVCYMKVQVGGPANLLVGLVDWRRRIGTTMKYQFFIYKLLTNGISRLPSGICNSRGLITMVPLPSFGA